MYGSYDPDHPVIVGIAGPAGSGKTSTALGIIDSEGGAWMDHGDIVWDHLYHAMPLYEFSSIRTKTQGEGAKDRQLHMIHDLVRELLGSRISYDDATELVYDIYSMPISTEGKPREFLQNVGSMLRQYDPACFANWIMAKANARFNDWRRFKDYSEREKPFVVLVSDVRLMDELIKIKAHPNGTVLRFNAPQEILENRLWGRDHHAMTPEQWNHESEAIGRSDRFLAMVDNHIDTSLFTLEEQIDYTKQLILNTIGIDRKVNA